MRRANLAAIALACLALANAGPPPTSEAFAFYTFREQAGPITVVVDGYPASLHAKDAYVPLTLAVGLLSGRARITVTPESFTLIDRTGRAYAAVPYPELLRNYAMREFDAALQQLRPLVVGEQFATSVPLPARFYPPASAPGTRIDRVELAPFTWFQSVVYFPRPEAGLDGVLSLRVAGGGVDPPVVVRFRVPQPVGGEPLEASPREAWER